MYVLLNRLRRVTRIKHEYGRKKNREPERERERPEHAKGYRRFRKFGALLAESEDCGGGGGESFVKPYIKRLVKSQPCHFLNIYMDTFHPAKNLESFDQV